MRHLGVDSISLSMNFPADAFSQLALGSRGSFTTLDNYFVGPDAIWLKLGLVFKLAK